ncbi:MAG: MFS transporter [Bacillota bacterium]|nr:MFS transporter [Bacillota bacterium]
MSLALLYVIVFIIMLIFNSTFTVIPMYLIRIGGTPFIAGVQTALFFAVSISTRFYFGPLADRVGRKVPLIIGISCFTLSSFLFIYSEHVWLVALVRLIQALGLSAFLSSSMSAVADRAPTGKLGAVMSTYRIISTFSLLVGPAVAMQIIGVYQYKSWFAICTVLGLLSILLLMIVPFNPITSHSKFYLNDSMLSLLFRPKYRLVYFGIALTAISYGALLSFASLHISAVMNIANPGIYFISFGVASLFFTFLSGYLSDRWGRAAIAWPSLIILGIGVSLLAFLSQGQIIVLIISSWFAGVGFNGGLSVLSAWLVDLADINKRATVLSMQESIIDFSFGFIALAFGTFSISSDFSVAFLLTGVVITCCGVILSFVQRRNIVYYNMR